MKMIAGIVAAGDARDVRAPQDSREPPEV